MHIFWVTLVLAIEAKMLRLFFYKIFIFLQNFFRDKEHVKNRSERSEKQDNILPFFRESEHRGYFIVQKPSHIICSPYVSTYPIFLWWCICVYSSICLFISMCSWMQAGILLPSYLFIYLNVLLSIYLSWRWWFYKWHKTFIITNTVLNPTININLSIFYLLTYLPILYYNVLSICQYIFLYWTKDILPLHKLALYILSYSRNIILIDKDLKSKNVKGKKFKYQSIFILSFCYP